MSRDWNGASYDRVSLPLAEMGSAVLARLELTGAERVLDAGCGSGRVTAELLERLPHGSVVAVDGSPAMIEAARERLGSRAELVICDLLELELSDPVDAVFSTATFHWILDHAGLFGRLHRALRPGGRLVAQCGGEGNVAEFRERLGAVMAKDPFGASFAGWCGPWNFAGVAETKSRLRRAGFREARCWLEPVRVTPPDAREFLRTVMLGSHLERLADEQREPFVVAVAATLEHPAHVDYVRLNIDASA